MAPSPRTQTTGVPVPSSGSVCAAADVVSSVVVFHQRFSTNTAPAWKLAQPFRLLAHNGEINTIEGNRRWASARAAKWRWRSTSANSTRWFRPAARIR